MKNAFKIQMAQNFSFISTITEYSGAPTSPKQNSVCTVLKISKLKNTNTCMNMSAYTQHANSIYF